MPHADSVWQVQEILGRPVHVGSLDTFRRDRKLYKALRSFICSLDSVRDNRKGILSWWWMLFHAWNNRRQHLCFDQQIYFYDKEQPIILSTIFVNKDARFLRFRRSIPGLWLAGFLVNRDFRGRGLGRLALAHAEAELERRLRERGATSVRLNLFTGNDRALQLYKSFGYMPLGKLGKRKTILSKEVRMGGAGAGAR